MFFDYHSKLAEYQDALGNNRIRIWDVPVPFRRGEFCELLYYASTQYTASRSNTRSLRFQEDMAFLMKELSEAENQEQYVTLRKTLHAIAEAGLRQALYPPEEARWIQETYRLQNSPAVAQMGLSPEQFAFLNLHEAFRKELAHAISELAQKHLQAEPFQM